MKAKVNDNAAILAAYDSANSLHAEFTHRVEELLRDLIDQEGLHIHSITSRVKKRESLERKLRRADANYADLSGVTDVCGIRVITYFVGDVDRIAKVIEREFSIDPDNSVDKRAILDPDKFGYLSLHYVFGLSSTRLVLPEYKRYRECKAEVQVRSIIQHAWAEIEHDLGYKSEQAIPRQIRRRFFRLAAMLEIADDEFASLKSSIDQYTDDVRTTLSEGSLDVAIDTASVGVFVSDSELVKELDAEIARNANAYFAEPRLLEFDVTAARFLNLGTLADLSTALKAHRTQVVELARRWLTPTPKPQEIPAGISLFYLYYILATKDKDVTQTRKYLEAVDIGVGNTRPDLAKKLVETVKEIQNGARILPRVA